MISAYEPTKVMVVVTLLSIFFIPKNMYQLVIATAMRETNEKPIEITHC